MSPPSPAARGARRRASQNRWSRTTSSRRSRSAPRRRSRSRCRTAPDPTAQRAAACVSVNALCEIPQRHDDGRAGEHLEDALDRFRRQCVAAPSLPIATYSGNMSAGWCGSLVNGSSTSQPACWAPWRMAASYWAKSLMNHVVPRPLAPAGAQQPAITSGSSPSASAISSSPMIQRFFCTVSRQVDEARSSGTSASAPAGSCASAVMGWRCGGRPAARGSATRRRERVSPGGSLARRSGPGAVCLERRRRASQWRLDARRRSVPTGWRCRSRADQRAAGNTPVRSAKRGRPCPGCASQTRSRRRQSRVRRPSRRRQCVSELAARGDEELLADE